VRRVFVDAGYWIALIDPRDLLRAQVLAESRRRGEHYMTTTQMVLDEVLAAFSSRGPQLRTEAADLVQWLVDESELEVVAQTDSQFRTALRRYADRPDQRWSLTDCASFLVMEERGISEALAYDRDFEQAGFVALLRNQSA
jgi:predicted nucleic acid-binding protein